MSWTTKQREVIQLLQDYNLKYPSGAQGTVNFEAMNSAYSSGWPLNEECLRRMGRGAVAETYKYLDYAITVLKGTDYEAYTAVAHLYLVEEASPSDLEYYRGKRLYESIIAAHDRGVRKLAEYLVNVELYVRWPERQYRRIPSDQESHNEAHRIVAERIAQGMGKTAAVVEASAETGLSESTVWRVLRARTVTQ